MLFGALRKSLVQGTVFCIAATPVGAQTATGLVHIPARVACVIESPEMLGRIVEIACPACPGRTMISLELTGIDSPRPEEGQAVRVICEMEDGNMRLVTIDWTPSGP